LRGAHSALLLLVLLLVHELLLLRLERSCRCHHGPVSLQGRLQVHDPSLCGGRWLHAVCG